MLRPDERGLYLELLRPPAGYALHRAVGTTFSVDLASLLAVPLSFARLDMGDSRDDLLADPVRLLRSLREYADRITLFCQAGRIAASAKGHPLYAHLERMLVEAVAQVAPDQVGEFHAKTWLLRFMPEESEAPVRYRFLNMSRNLTTDRSWDGVVVLEGDLAQRTRAIAANHPLGDFLAALPALAKRPISGALQDDLAMLSDEVRRVRFEAPEPFEGYTFAPLGIPGHRDLDLGAAEADRLLVVSPFIAAARLERLAKSDANVLVSRAESLDALEPTVLAAFQQVLTLDEGTEDQEPIELGGDELEAGEGAGQAPPSGLHAKLYLLERGWDATLWLGSANATDAAFTRNVEFLVGLTGKRSKIGVDQLLGVPDGRELTFGSLLAPYRAPATPPPPDDGAKANEEAVEAARRVLSRADLRLQAVPSLDAAGLYDVTLRLAGALGPSDEVRGRCWPMGMTAPHGWNLDALRRDGQVVFMKLPLSRLSAFLVFELEAGAGDARRAARFTLLLPMEGAPDDRMEQLLAAVLEEQPGRFLQFLQLLLADPDRDPVALAEALGPSERQASGRRQAGEEVPLLEDLLKVLARAPERLAEVQRLVEDLRKSPAGAKVLPEGFDAIWGPIWAASQEVA